jgi:hypothetical protein
MPVAERRTFFNGKGIEDVLEIVNFESRIRSASSV